MFGTANVRSKQHSKLRTSTVHLILRISSARFLIRFDKELEINLYQYNRYQ